MMLDNVIELRGLSFAYKPGEPVLQGLELEFTRGNLHVIIGGNGSGKSTLIKLLRGLLPSDPGMIRFVGCDQWQEVGLVFQNPDNQIVGTTVLEDVSFGPANLGLPREIILQRVEAALTTVGLQEKKHFNPHHLSGGERQRLALAGVLAMEPKVLLLDEATSMLDPESRAAILKVLKGLAQQGMTILHVTHHMDEAMRADQVLVLGQGRLLLGGPPATVFQEEGLLRKFGLGLPPEQEFIAALRKRSQGRFNVPATINTCEALVEWVQGLSDATQVRQVNSVEVTREVAVVAQAVSAHVLEELNFSITSGGCTAVIGPSGAGKTTLARIMAGLLTPRRGQLTVRGTCGLVLQYPEDQLFAATVQEEVMFGPLNQQHSKRESRQRAQKALAAVELDLSVFGNRPPFVLSGGQKRKVAIASILAMQPDILILDEPTVGLDPRSRLGLVKLLRQLKGQYTLVVISHDADLIDAVADQVLVIKQGRIQGFGTPLEVFADARLREVGAQVIPQRTGLIQRCEELGIGDSEFCQWLKGVDLYEL